MAEEVVCPECGLISPSGETCQELFEKLLAREFEDTRYGEVHHLTVLCFNLQHPARFSDDANSWARTALKAVLEEGIQPEELRRRSRKFFGAPKKTKVLAQEPVPHQKPASWSMHVSDVVGDGEEGHNERVRAWARAVLTDLQKAGLI